ncbi:glycosyltransferase family 39 protein [Dactylosporangium sp. CA-152071]|uniref:glycosyltransferase family 39 protein n=1 Tax=Dactylosporangium sp. CA-152071 TaxID=3239933 RepID=UPI003D937E5C
MTSASITGEVVRAAGSGEPRVPTVTPRWRRLLAAHYFWVVPGLVMLGLGRYQYLTPRLWRDEIATWSAAVRSVPELFDLLGNTDAVAGGHYLFMHYWIAVFGDSAASLRTPSLLAMAAAAALVALTGNHLHGGAGGLAAGLLFAAIPATSRFAQEARSYAFATLAAALATYLFVRALDRPGWGRWAWYSAALVLVGYAHLVALLLLSGHAVAVAWLLAVDRDRRLLRWPAAAGLGIAALSPLILVARRQRTTQIGWMPVPAAHDLLPTLTMVTASTLVAGALVGMAAAGSRRGGTRSLLVCAGGVLAPPIAGFVVSQSTPIWWPRYLLFLLPALALLAARALARAAIPAVVAGAVLVGLLGLPDQLAIRGPAGHEADRYPAGPWYTPPNWFGAARIVRSGQRPGDGIVYVGDSDRARSMFMLRSTMDYYLRTDAARPKDVYLDRSAAQIGAFWARECADPKACLAGTGRVWVVAVSIQDHIVAGARNDAGLAALQGYRSVQVWHPGGLTIELVQHTG